MFPTTIWTCIEGAALGGEEREAFARRYRPPVLHYIRGKGISEGDAEDICHDVFVRLLSGDVLARADAAKGRFRSLVLAITRHVIVDRHRKKSETPMADFDPEAPDEEFDRSWMLHLVERAMELLREESPSYFEVLRGHLEGRPQDRNKLWIARGKLVSRIRAEVAMTCRSREECEEELAYLSPYVRPRRNGGPKGPPQKK